MAGTGHDVTRIEAFSDAVFGFAITLLVVSLEVPDSFDELLRVMRGLPVFAVSFAILLMIWQEHHNLFKKFPASDGITIWLNGALLFVVLAYVYPMKFMFAGIVGPEGMRFGSGSAFIRIDQLVSLLLIYGIGFATIFLIFAALYWRASRRATDTASRHEARVLIGHSFVYVTVACLSMWLAKFGGPELGPLSGVTYGLLGPFQGLYHALAARYWKPAASGEPLQPAAPEAASTPGNERGSTP